MKKKILKIVLIAFLLNGCNYMRTFPLYSEVSVEHPQRIELFTPGIIEVYTGNPDSDNAKAYFRIKERIASYLNEKEDLRGDVADALKNCEVISGMDKEQVTLVLGLPTKKKRLDQTTDLWKYKGERNNVGERTWYYKWGKIKFENDVLADMEVQQINIFK